MRIGHLALLALLALSSTACTAATGDEEELVGADEDLVDREGENIAGTLSAGATLKATDNVNLRSGAGTGYKILKVIPKGATVTVVNGKPNGVWYNIKYAGITGFSHGAYFDTVGSTAPPPASGGDECTDKLTALGLTWRRAGATKGIVDPVTVASPIRDVAFRYVGSKTSSPVLGNCALFIKLAAAADKMKAWGVSEFTHIGTYNYRTIAGSSKLSQHALGMAIDIAGFKTTGGAYYTLASDFVKNTSAPTCTQPRTTAADKLLKGWACDAKSAGIFNIILTPNYNDLHRDHFHVDLTTGSDFIKSRDTDTAGTPFATDVVDPFSIEPLGEGFDDHGDEGVPTEALRRELEIQRDLGAVISPTPISSGT